MGGPLFVFLAADDERDEDLADAAAFEAEGDGQPGPVVGQGVTVRATMARTGPSMPRTPHVVGGSMWVTSE
jgi:hypothetical protein